MLEATDTSILGAVDTGILGVASPAELWYSWKPGLGTGFLLEPHKRLMNSWRKEALVPSLQVIPIALP